jgi:hypothetical protein
MKTPTKPRRRRANKKQNEPQLIVQDIRVQSVDRTRKEIKSFKMALQGAESITLPNRTKLYDLYSHILLDGHLSGIMGKRIDKVLNKAMYFQKDGKRVEAFDEFVRSGKFRKIRKRILESMYWGLSGLEFIPGEKVDFEEIPRKHIRPHKKLISTLQTGQEGVSYDDVSNIWVIGEKDDLGLLLQCSPYVIWKMGSMGDFSQYIEIFGQPVRIFKYDAYDTKTQTEVKKVLDESGSSLALMVPKQADFEMLDGKSTNATGELQDRFRIACNQEMSIHILGNTETTTSSASSGYAQSKVHEGEQLEITESDMAFMLSTLNESHFLDILRSYGFPVEGGRFVYEEKVNLKELKERLAIDKEVSKKVPIGDDYWYETYCVPKPENYNELKNAIENTKRAAIPEDAEYEIIEEGGKKTKAKKKGKRKKEPVKLSAYQRFFASLADFFDQAR